jgi:hypothetical protein
LLQRRVLLLRFGMVAGRRTGVHDVERREDSAMKCWKFLNKLVAEKATGGEVFRGGSSEMT